MIAAPIVQAADWALWRSSCGTWRTGQAGPLSMTPYRPMWGFRGLTTGLFQFDTAVVPEGILVRVVEGEIVFLNVESEEYFELDEVGTAMWRELTGGGTIAQAFDRLLEAYEVEPDRLRGDLTELIGRLRDAGLLELE